MAATTQSFTVRQIADSLGISEKTVRKWCASGDLSSIQVSPRSKILVLKGDLVEFLNKKRMKREIQKIQEGK